MGRSTIDERTIDLLLEEDGQLIDFELEILKEHRSFYKLRVSDNQYIDILGTGENDFLNITKNVRLQDPGLFLWD